MEIFYYLAWLYATRIRFIEADQDPDLADKNINCKNDKDLESPWKLQDSAFEWPFSYSL